MMLQLLEYLGRTILFLFNENMKKITWFCMKPFHRVEWLFVNIPGMWFLFLPEVFVGLWPLWASADDGGRGWGSYCGSGAAEQLDEFMVGSSSRCQAWFPPGAKHRPYGQPEVEEGQLPRYLKDLRDALSCFSCLYFLFTFLGRGFICKMGKGASTETKRFEFELMSVS